MFLFFIPLQLPMLTLLLIFFSSRFSILSSLYSSPRLSIPIHTFNFMFIIILPFSTCSLFSISFPLIYSTHLLLSPPHTYNIHSSTIISLSPAHIHATFYFITIISLPFFFQFPHTFSLHPFIYFLFIYLLICFFVFFISLFIQLMLLIYLFI